MIRERREIARYLVRRGARTDLLMATALGDAALVRRHLDSDPACIRMRVSDEFFPMINHKSGGTIYQWTLGWHVSAHDVARDFGHEEILRLLLERSPVDVKLIAACWAGDEGAVQDLLREDPGLPSRLSQTERRHVALAARNNNTPAVRTMLVAGLPADGTGQHGATPLHWAAFHGNVEMIRTLLNHPHRPPLEVTDADFQSTPLGWAIHGSEHGWHRRKGDYAGVVELLIDAGASLTGRQLAGTDAVRAVLRRRGVAG
jgi:ankyrin repeat protein